MAVRFSHSVIDLFQTPKHVFDGSKQFKYLGASGDSKLAEYVQLYADIKLESDKLNSILTEIKFSVLGSVLTIAYAERICSYVSGKTIIEGMAYCDPSLKDWIDIYNPDKPHLFNFAAQAFYELINSVIV